ncbi:MAG: Fe-S protein assembly co-chaperone HscB [Polyangiaceae bacterium]
MQATVMNNPFETLGLKPGFALDLPALERRQRELSRALHPDRFAGSSAGERRQALSRAMDVNQACRTLRDPLSRADAVLSVLGAPPVGGESERVTDPALLMEMLEQREELDEVRRRGDRPALASLKERMKMREQALIAELERAFEPLLGNGTGEAQALALVRRPLTELRYVRRYLDEVAVLEDEVG